ncbi:MAG: tRNA (adenine(22)-N(1))-methyltransferase [Desulfitobacteriia bacterium]|jgi:tRNA (adenine22-N1)-methyltransferase
MNKIKLGPRLEKIASFVPPGSLVGDIGTDHAYLLIYLLQKKVVSKAIGIEVHPGPYKAAVKNVRSYGLKDRIAIRFGDGLQPLEKGEIDTLVIAGIGGVNILDILQGNKEVMEGIKTLVLQPQSTEGNVRRNLLSLNWKLKGEDLVSEDNRIYTVLCFSATEGYKGRQIEERNKLLLEEFQCFLDSGEDLKDTIDKYIWQFGPLLLSKKEKLLYNLIEAEIVKNEKIIRDLEKAKSDNPELQTNRSLREREIKVLGGIKKWLCQ